MRLTRGAKEIKELAEKLRQARMKAGLSTQQLADLIDLTAQQVRRFESGRGEPSALVLGRIIRALEPQAASKHYKDTLAYHLLDHVRTDEELADQLWNEHHLAEKMPESSDIDFKAKKAILKAMKIWQR